MSTYVVVEISPDTTTRPVFTSVSHATRPVGSSRMTASRMPSEIWSAILSGWPSVTDSEVNRYSFSESFMVSACRGGRTGSRRRKGRIRVGKGSGLLRVPLLPPPVVDHQRHPLQLIPGSQPVLDEV